MTVGGSGFNGGRWCLWRWVGLVKVYGGWWWRWRGGALFVEAVMMVGGGATKVQKKNRSVIRQEVDCTCVTWQGKQKPKEES